MVTGHSRRGDSFLKAGFTSRVHKHLLKASGAAFQHSLCFVSQFLTKRQRDSAAPFKVLSCRSSWQQARTVCAQKNTNTKQHTITHTHQVQYFKALVASDSSCGGSKKSLDFGLSSSCVGYWLDSPVAHHIKIFCDIFFFFLSFYILVLHVF